MLSLGSIPSPVSCLITLLHPSACHYRRGAGPCSGGSTKSWWLEFAQTLSGEIAWGGWGGVPGAALLGRYVSSWLDRSSEPHPSCSHPSLSCACCRTAQLAEEHGLIESSSAWLEAWETIWEATLAGCDDNGDCTVSTK